MQVVECGSMTGVVFAVLTIACLRSIRPTVGRVSTAARWIFVQSGLTIFIAGVGLRAGLLIMKR